MGVCAFERVGCESIPPGQIVPGVFFDFDTSNSMFFADVVTVLLMALTNYCTPLPVFSILLADFYSALGADPSSHFASLGHQISPVLRSIS